MDADRSVRAVFGPAFYRLTVRVLGRGRVRSTLLPACRSRCVDEIPADLVVTLRAAPARGWRLAAWRGCTSTPRGSCRVRVSRARPVTAIFRRA